MHPSVTARFWTTSPTGEPCKISLAAGKALTHILDQPTDEGWRRTINIWRHHGDHISQRIAVHGQDCDGLLTRLQTLTCPLELLHARTSYNPRLPLIPAWHIGPERVIDHQAIAAGY